MAAEGWESSCLGTVVGGEPQCIPDTDGYGGLFKHSLALAAGDVWKMKSGGGAGYAIVGFAMQAFDCSSKTIDNTAGLRLGNGYVVVWSDISLDGEQHVHPNHHLAHIPETETYQLALRIDKDGNVPQVQFNEDGVWHDFAPGRDEDEDEDEDEDAHDLIGAEETRPDRVALKEGPWFPYLCLYKDARVTDHRVDRPRARKSARKHMQQGATAAEGGVEAASKSSQPPLHKKVRKEHKHSLKRRPL